MGKLKSALQSGAIRTPKSDSRSGGAAPARSGSEDSSGTAAAFCPPPD